LHSNTLFPQLIIEELFVLNYLTQKIGSRRKQGGGSAENAKWSQGYGLSVSRRLCLPVTVRELLHQIVVFLEESDFEGKRHQGRSRKERALGKNGRCLLKSTNKSSIASQGVKSIIEAKQHAEKDVGRFADRTVAGLVLC
jgi:hypothetical protein